MNTNPFIPRNVLSSCRVVYAHKYVLQIEILMASRLRPNNWIYRHLHFTIARKFHKCGLFNSIIIILTFWRSPPTLGKFINIRISHYDAFFQDVTPRQLLSQWLAKLSPPFSTKLLKEVFAMHVNYQSSFFFYQKPSRYFRTHILWAEVWRRNS
jgi:hypothetical protein